MSKKCYAVMKGEKDKLGPDLIAVFASEGEAEQSAEAHRTDTTRAWVEEVNYYE